MTYHLSVVNNFYLKTGDQPRISWGLENIRQSRIKADLGRTGETRLTQNQSRFFETGGSPRISWDLGQPTPPRIKEDLGRTKNKLRPWTVTLTKGYSESWSPRISWGLGQLPTPRTKSGSWENQE